MSWSDNVGRITSWLGDITGVSDVADELALVTNGVSNDGGSLAKVGFQALQVPLETTFVAPLRAITKAGEIYYEDFFRPYIADTAKAAIMAGPGAAVWKKENETYGQYLAKAWERRDEISYGEVVGMGYGEAIDKVVPGNWSKFDPFSDKSQEEWRGSNLHYLSGTVDFAKDIFLDPLTYLGAPAKASTAAARGARIVSDADRTAASILSRKGTISHSGMLAALEDGRHAKAVEFIGTETNRAVIAEWAKSSRMGIVDPDGFASLAAQVNGADEAQDLLKVLYLQDGAAADRLAATHGAGYDLTLRSAEYARQVERRAAATGEQIIDDPKVLAGLGEHVAEADASPQVAAALKRAEEFTRGLDKAMDVGARPQRFLPNEARMAGRREVVRQQKRAVATVKEITREPIVTVYRPSRLHPLQFIVERPSGLLRPEAPDAFGELAAQMREVNRITDGRLVDSGLADELTDAWLAAGSHADPASARGEVAHRLNEIAIGLITDKYRPANMDPEAFKLVADDMFARATEKTQSAMKLGREKGWLGMALDSGGMGVLRTPVLMRTTPNAVQLWDVRQIDRYFARHEGDAFGRIYHSAVASGLVDTADLVNSIFKVSVLMRLGYTVRNLAEATASIAATGNFGHVLAAVGPERAATMMKTAKMAPARVVDRLAQQFNLRDNAGIAQQVFDNEDAALAAWNAHLDELARNIAYTDHTALINSDDPEQAALGLQLLMAQQQMKGVDTFHGTAGGLELDPERPLSTTGSRLAAERHADQQAWQPMKVSDFAAYGNRRGLLSPHPDVDRNLTGRMDPQRHGTGRKWTGDYPDPDRRAQARAANPTLFDDKGRLLPDWEKISASHENLVGMGFYTSNSALQTSPDSYIGYAHGPDPQEYTVRWKHLRPPRMFDADRPAREIDEVQSFLDDFLGDLSAVAKIVDPEEPGFRIDATIDAVRNKVLNPPEPQHASGINKAIPTVDALMSGQITQARALERLDDILKHEPLAPPQEKLVREAREAIANDADPADIGELVGRLETSETMAWNWYPMYYAPYEDKANSMMGGLGRLVGGTLLANAAVPYGRAKYVNDPAVRKLFKDWFDVEGDDLDRYLGDMYDRLESGAGDFEEMLDAFEQEAMLLMNAAFSKRLREEGFDGIQHSSGMGSNWANPSVANAQSGLHKVMVFLNEGDVSVVGRDWMDYDNVKILDAARVMSAQLLEQVQAGAKVRRIKRDERPMRGATGGDHGAVDYVDVTESEIRGWLENPVAMARAFKYSPKKKNPLSFKEQFEVLPAGANPQAVAVTSYGNTADLTDWANVPDDLRQAMNWKQRIVKTGPRRQKRSFSGDRRAVKVGDQAAIDRVTTAAFDLGYARVVVPDRNAFGGVQVIVNPKAVGPEGMKREVQKEVDRLSAERMGKGFDTPDVGPVTREQRKREKAVYRANGNQMPKPIIPDLDAAMAQHMVNGGLPETVSYLLSQRAAAAVRREAAGVRLTAARARTDALQSLQTQGRGFGQKSFAFKGPFGEDYEVMGPFAGHAGTLHHRLTSSDDTYHNLIIGSDLATHAGAADVPKLLAPDNPRYYEGWSRLLNMHFRDPESGIIDPVVTRILEGMTYDDAVKWATTTREGYDWAQAIGLPRSATATIAPELRDEALAAAQKRAGTAAKFDPENVEEALAGLYRAVDLYLPEGPIRQRFAVGEVDEQFLRKARQGMENQPLHALLVPTSKEARLDWKAKDHVNSGITKAMRMLGAMPETSFARHPLYVTYFQQEATTRIRYAAERKGEALTKGEIDKILASTHKIAKRDLEKTLYTIVRRSNVSGAVAPRLLFPFASAYENVLRRWGGFVAADPSLPMRAGTLIAKFVTNAQFLDQNGEVLQNAGDVSPDSMLVLPGMRSIAKFVPGKYGRALESQAQGIQIPFASMDVLFQGRPGDPGVGPFGLLPIAEVLKRKPEFETFLGWTMPYGVPESSMDVFLPAWAKRFKSRAFSDAAYTNAIADAYLFEQWKFEQGQRDTEPTLTEVTDIANAMVTIRAMTNLTAPVSVNYTNERDFFVAKLRSLREKYSGDPDGYRKADAEFFLQFPDTQMLVHSLSENSSGAKATLGAVDNLKTYREEAIDAYALGDPELAGFIANYGSAGNEPFSDAAYDWEKSNSPVPGSKDTYRQVANPEESVRSAHIEQGWREWRGYLGQVESALVAGGYSPDSAEYGRVVQKAKSLIADAIGAENQDWHFEYINPDSAKYFRRASYFEELVSDSQFAKDKAGDPLMQSISMYLSQRKAVQAAVEARANAGGSKTLTAQSNQDIAAEWEAIVGRLKADSPEFATWADRYFANDPVVAR